MFQTAIDVANRACQHCGVPLLDATLGFSEVSTRSSALQFAYGKVKRAELRRNVWRFATRRTVIRPIDTNTMLLVPTLWQAGVTYFQSSVVADSTGFMWVSKIQNNIGIQPNTTTQTAWDPYFGPLTASLYDSTQSYFADEVVYTAPGDGTYNVYLSLISANQLDPSLSNLWSSATTYNANNIVVVYPAWASGTSYSQGQTVTYTNGSTYSSLTNANVGNIPSNTVGTSWALMPDLQLVAAQINQSQTFNTLTPYGMTSPIIAWYVGTTYSLGQFVTFDGNVYVSINASNTGNIPNAAASAYWAEVTLGTLYMSLINLNTNNSPANAPALWAVGTTYAANALVGGSDGSIYKSVGSGNVGNNPVTDAGVHWTNTGVLNPWTTVFSQGGGNQQWLQIGGAAFPAGVSLLPPNISWPIGAGPYEQTETKNVYRLPAGYLRTAPQDPSAGAISWLGFPGNLIETDWTYNGNYMVTGEGDPIPYRFVADVTYVPDFDDMFCEALAYRVALSVVETLTAKQGLKADIEREYKKFRDEGAIINGIEQRPVSPPLDDLISCRV